ncbi:hypothetical protein JL857_07235 [Vibrio parahaemolyticus]|uniref:Uncharacterized protein n=5 Tax=Bacteria TaxID=2 RepID=A0A9Q3YLT1_VIBPH|nr:MULTISPECIES: hypothetical protein [Vibrio]HDM8233727.1 hypothetical protein [Vibrio campbellii]EGQ8099459.1 hypothetical protein [Vibrio parahaemolyticus]EGQ9075124.1 hypothetical protein [Vibrio parahaemolyticus]EGQ9108713.1 hypothetical protein [Vibrio cholerae]EGQ9132294.1 hypothetical protein [Vibrio parahaemolyticus]
MYEINCTEIRNEMKPVELIWKCLAFLDAKAGDQVSESLFNRRSTKNSIVDSEQIEAALEVLNEAGLIDRLPSNKIQLTAGLNTIADFSSRTLLPNSNGN